MENRKESLNYAVFVHKNKNEHESLDSSCVTVVIDGSISGKQCKVFHAEWDRMDQCAASQGVVA